jgi:hypothetical protein
MVFLEGHQRPMEKVPQVVITERLASAQLAVPRDISPHSSRYPWANPPKGKIFPGASFRGSK